ncbi:MAG: hypothetical protein HZA51_01520 [Planctomycetes bacterium]|nr:hypothetical protein [Planctomycetota bacterium]
MTFESEKAMKIAGVPEENSSKFFVEWTAKQRAANDQLALIVDGYNRFASHEYVEAQVTFQKAINGTPSENEYLAHYGKAMCIIRGNEDTREWMNAKQPLEIAHKQAPDFVPVLYQLTRLLQVNDKNIEALVAADRLVDRMPYWHEAYSMRGVLWAKLKVRERFKADFDKALELNPGDANTLISMGDSYLEFDLYDLAISCFESAIRADESYWYGYYRLALCQGSRRNYAQAITMMEKTIKLLGLDGPITKDCEARLAEWKSILSRP